MPAVFCLLLRTGSLVGAALSAMPLWRRVDPLAILALSDDERKKLLLFRGEESSLEFVTTAVDEYSESAADLAGLKFVRLYADDEGLKAAERIFFMGVDELASESEEEFVFAPEVESLEFEYMDVDEDTGTAQWISDLFCQGF